MAKLISKAEKAKKKMKTRTKALFEEDLSEIEDNPQAPPVHKKILRIS